MSRHPDRKQEILEVLARELESSPGSRVTTASLAAAVGVSEAALYRHFASKAKMFEALIEFAETTVFGLASRILTEQPDAEARCRHIFGMTLMFAERNPGIARVLLGDALVGENVRLRARVGQFFERLEMQFRQILKEARAQQVALAGPQPGEFSALMVSVLIGKIDRYARTDFRQKPTEDWEAQWAVLRAGGFAGAGPNRGSA